MCLLIVYKWMSLVFVLYVYTCILYLFHPDVMFKWYSGIVWYKLLSFCNCKSVACSQRSKCISLVNDVSNIFLVFWRYVELREKDTIKFGYSSRDFVILHDNTQVSPSSSDAEGWRILVYAYLYIGAEHIKHTYSTYYVYTCIFNHCK